MYPAAQSSVSGMILVTSAFGITTLLTMMATVAMGVYGFSFIPFKRIGAYAHAIAGTMIFLSGLAIQVLGI